ncbi:MAG: 2-amino-4-hydroxy-6-hydroxymethyldihydropteridine diphosphokinase [Pseudomonadota bacterium]
MTQAALSLGSNIGDRVSTLRSALDKLHGQTGVSIKKVSAFYETAPWGKLDQDHFINMCILVETELSPEELLDVVQKVERELGRLRAERWGPRIIDIDILFFGTREINEPDLTIPHKSLKERAFVLVPLAEIAADTRINNVTVAELADRLHTNENEVVKTGDVVWNPKN